MKKLLYLLIIPFLLVSCFEKDNPEPKMTTTTENKPIGMFKGDLYSKYANGQEYIHYAGATRQLFLNQVGEVCWETNGPVNPQGKLVYDSLAIEITDNTFTIKCIVPPAGSSGSYVSEGHGIINDSTSFSLNYQTTDPSTGLVKPFWGTFVKVQ